MIRVIDTEVKNIDQIPTATIENQKGRSDNTNATRFINDFGDRLRYVQSWKAWLYWTGKKWCRKLGEGKSLELAREWANALWVEASELVAVASIPDKEKSAIVTYAKKTNSANSIEAILKLAKADSRIRIDHGDLDSDPYLLNLLNGTYDLRASSFRAHQREDLITQIANVKYDPDANSPRWNETIDLIFAGDSKLAEYVQKIYGYALAGTTGETLLPIQFGNGSNGKSTLWNTVHSILGDYAGTASQELLMPSRSQHPTELADLYGKRFVAVAEPENGRKLNEARAKDLTGDDTVKARRLYENYWSFKPTHTFFISTNHLPQINGCDDGIWRRVKLIPFSVDLRNVVKVDPDFRTKLMLESSGILNWLLDGWYQYREMGLQTPKAVLDATDEYRSNEDVLATFIEEAMVVDPDYKYGDYKQAKKPPAGYDYVLTAGEAWNAYEKFGSVFTRSIFGKMMAERFDKCKPRTTFYLGLRLRKPYETDI